MPDAVFEHYYDVSPQYLSDLGVKALIIDIDNTLAPYEAAEPDERLASWLHSLRENGISAALMSNNDRIRVERFNKRLGLPAFYKSGKPFGKNLRRAMKIMESDKTDTAVIGDQLLTDVLSGKLLGLRAILVPPIKDRSSVFFRFKRSLEVPTVKKYVKRANDESALAACDFWINKRYKCTKSN